MRNKHSREGLWSRSWRGSRHLQGVAGSSAVFLFFFRQNILKFWKNVRSATFSAVLPSTLITLADKYVYKSKKPLTADM